MADTSTPPSTASPAKADKDAATLQREHVERLLAQAPATAEARIKLGGKALDYRVEASFTPVRPHNLEHGAGDPEAAVMTTAYLLKGAKPAERPLCFAFNGGPGSASIWLQFGALGPKRVVVPDDGSMPRAPYAVEDNPLSWFEHFDLVFIDPPHTGWSSTASADARKKMLSVQGDVDALAEVMRAWLTSHGRWGSPLYLAGANTMLCRSIARLTRITPLKAAPISCILSASAAPRVVP
jgi:carboxypeptidase C (cathepsin A)